MPGVVYSNLIRSFFNEIKFTRLEGSKFVTIRREKTFALPSIHTVQ